jgi:L-cysteine desulfidase
VLAAELVVAAELPVVIVSEEPNDDPEELMAALVVEAVRVVAAFVDVARVVVFALVDVARVVVS